MVAYRLAIKPAAAKELDRVGQKRDRVRIVARIQDLASEPRPPGCEKLAGGVQLYRLRQGQYRIVYEIDDKVRSADVIKIGHRREVYRDV